ncbi:MAG: hypothetical protein LBK07_03990 [Tannerella sp.]|jgi:hypothetical protein|nr:hypothetical protein [Tannerella sp.]
MRETVFIYREMFPKCPLEGFPTCGILPDFPENRQVIPAGVPDFPGNGKKALFPEHFPVGLQYFIPLSPVLLILFDD